MTVKTSKIVAGHEAEKTNELLQLMGKIIENKLNWQSAVEQVLKGKDHKEQEKSKDKEVAKTKDPSLKTTGKNTEKISKHSSVNKEDKIKKAKEKEKPTTTKQKASSKTNKVEDNRTTKKSKESATKKLTKADSQSSNKSITPNKELKVQKKKEQIETPDPIQCSHEGMSLQDMEIKRKTSISLNNNKDNLDSLNKYIAQQKEDLMGPEINQEQHIMPPSSAGIASTSAKSITLDNLEITLKRDNGDSRKSSGKSRKSPSKNDSVESPQNDGTNSRKSSGKRRKQLTDEDNRETTEDNNSKKSSVKAKPIEHKAEQLTEQPSLEQDSPARNLENVTALPETSLKNLQHETPSASKTAGIVNTEVKRESTFTRENSKDLTNKTNRPRTSLRPPSARPPSARPGAPRRRDRNIEIILQPNDQIKMSGIQVKLETFGDLDDDSENLVIIENTDTANDDMTNNIMGDITKSQAALDGEIVEQQGHLVQQILETQKELTQEKDFNQQIKNEKVRIF